MAGPGALLLGTNIVAQILGGIVLLLACTSLGLAKLIALSEAAELAQGKHRALEIDYWKITAARSATTQQLVAPAAKRWFVANGQEVSGPFTEEQIRALKSKGVVTAETQLAVEGTQDWRPLAKVLAV